MIEIFMNQSFGFFENYKNKTQVFYAILGNFLAI